MTNKAKHIHECACGDYYVCSQRDGCPEHWECPHCVQEQIDAWTTGEEQRQQAAQAAQEQA